MQSGPVATFWLKSLAVTLSCVTFAFAATNSIIWERGDQIVQLTDQDEAAVLPNDHPVTTTANEIGDMLRMLHLRYAEEDASSTPVPIFTSEEIDNLGKAIATGLGRAAPSQDIIFHVIGAHRASPGAWLKRNRVSTGRVFFRDGHINVIFGQVQTPYRKKNLYGQTKEDFYPRNYGSRKAAAEHEVILVTTSGIRLFENQGQVRNDWVVISPDAALPAVAEKKAEPRTIPVATPVAESSKPSVEPVMPVAESSRPSVEPVMPVAESSKQSSPPSMPVAREPAAGMGQSREPSGRAAATDMERRLEELKRLRERDLISEEVYQAKMKEILQEL